ncbi:hypothetical protein [uncultured Helicobacter sp.]|uniref:hypothetical protein n=1 Tax=uncultured Helicobacter sp. TaxID=175537 RepID=UPI0025878F56|nr:hypothetical protein [uncultured Helicobacter sp.]
MKKICCIVALCVVGVFGATDLPTSAVSIRSMATGYLLKNNTKKAKSVNWEMKEVLLPPDIWQINILLVQCSFMTSKIRANVWLIMEAGYK